VISVSGVNLDFKEDLEFLVPLDILVKKVKREYQAIQAEGVIRV